jgi:YHS domain-containing protein
VIILFILFYILFRLVLGGKKRQVKGRAKVPPVHDVLVEDPICKVFVPKKQAVILQEAGKETYFCSRECREKFIAMKGDQR